MRRSLICVLGVLLVMLSACERSHWDPTVKVGDPKGHIIGKQGPLRGRDTRTYPVGERGVDLGSGTTAPAPQDSIESGTGTFVRKITPPAADTAPGDVTLNFDGTDIREVVKVILGDLLQVNYVLDPNVQGAASLQTGRPLQRKHLIPTLETLLRMNNAALVNRGGTYEVVPLTAVQGRVIPQLGESSQALPVGYSVQVVPLHYIGAEEMSRILQPLAPEGSIIRIDNLRNLLVLAGTSPEIGNLLDTIQVFDVDWMSGLSVGFFTLDYATAGDVVTQLNNLLADESGNPFKGLFHFVPVDSANSILVVSPQEKYLKQAQNWIERLDLAEAAGGGEERLFVYRVKHGDAEELADILTKLFASDHKDGRSVGGVAPGLRRTSIASDKGKDDKGKKGESGTQRRASPKRTVAGNIELSSKVSIVADSVNNSLLIRSNPRDYKKIVDALKQLDLVPLQVLVEATILEITLSGNLKYGVQWQFRGSPGGGYSFDFSLDGQHDNQSQSGIGPSFPGFNWTTVLRPETIRSTLNALAGEGLVNVLSSPSVMVLDNQTAEIQVGKEVPVATSQQQGTSQTDRIINQIQYRSTGVQLSVTPRVTPGGLVQMEIKQEVSTVAQTDSSALDSPTFQTRKITSNVAVRSNQAVVLGGLIEDKREESNQGVPGLYNLPIIGPLFGERSRKADRTELVVVLTPRVIASDADLKAITDDFRSRLKGLEYRF